MGLMVCCTRNAPQITPKMMVETRRTAVEVFLAMRADDQQETCGPENA